LTPLSLQPLPGQECTLAWQFDYVVQYRREEGGKQDRYYGEAGTLHESQFLHVRHWVSPAEDMERVDDDKFVHEVEGEGQFSEIHEYAIRQPARKFF
jgi:hypothetical protein